MIQKRGKVYWLDFRVGKKRYRRSLGTDEHGLALDRAQEIRQKIKRANSRKDIRFSDIIEKYKDWARLQKPASMRTEGYQLTWLEAFMISHNVVYLADVTPFLVERMRTELRARRKGKTKKNGPTGATINRYCQLLRCIFYRAADWGFFTGENPVKRIKFLKERPAVPVIEASDMEKIMEAAREISADPGSPAQRAFADIALVALNTGMRKSEILNLRWRDIRDDVADVLGKGDKRREVPLNRTARETIMRQSRAGEFVFSIPNRHQPDLFKRTYALMAKKTGRPFYIHLLRHRFATSLLERGVDIVTLASILGHSRSMVTLTYSHTDPARKKRAVELIES